MRRRIVAVVVGVLLAGCRASPEHCTQLANERATARGNLSLDGMRALQGDSYAEASLAHDRDEVRRTERAYDEACSR
jgi:hypothetical protein